MKTGINWYGVNSLRKIGNRLVHLIGKPTTVVTNVTWHEVKSVSAKTTDEIRIGDQKTTESEGRLQIAIESKGRRLLDETVLGTESLIADHRIVRSIGVQMRNDAVPLVLKVIRLSDQAMKIGGSLIFLAEAKTDLHMTESLVTDTGNSPVRIRGMAGIISGIVP